jgi:hypothetical protein
MVGFNPLTNNHFLFTWRLKKMAKKKAKKKVTKKKATKKKKTSKKKK